MYNKYKMSVQEFSADDIKRKLIDAHEKGQLEKEFRCLWHQYVPAVYSLRLDADSTSEERKSKKLLFSPMEVFLCKDDPQYVFSKLKESDNPPQLCGKVFKLGEPTYSCRDCGVDPTCVLCIECFQNSAHNKHRYRMSTSGGGGYCDCGDEEAWKNHPFCEVHQRGVESNKKDPIELLQPDLADRARALFFAVIKYASQMMLWVHPDSLPSDLQPDTMPDTYITMLFNDEVHTYEQVITTLQKAVDASQKEAVDFATTVDREGRSPVKYGKFDECSKAKEIIVKNTSRAGSKPLKVDVMHTTVVAHQMFASRMLTWLQGVVSKSEGLRKLFCLLLMEKEDGGVKSILEEVMLADTVLWKAARVQTHQLFMSGVLMDQECKRKFSIIFTKRYRELMASFIQDDHERKVSILSCSVQIFTNPTVAKMLIAEHNLLQVILDTFLAECENKKKDGKFAFEKQDRHHSFRRAQYALYDLKYALVTKPSPEEWTHNLRSNFINGFCGLLQLLKYMQGMDCVKRQTGQHIEFEPEWEGAFNLQLKLEDNIAIMVDWCQTDRDVLLRACEFTIKALEEKQSEEESKHLVRKVANHVVQCIDYNVAKDPVSIHLPVTRILASLFPQSSRFDEAIQDIEALIRMSSLTPEQLIEPSLKCLVMIAQTQANMWKRNGYSLLNQIYFYHNVRCRTQMYDCDILMLQAGATIMDANHFIIHLLNKFGLNNWIKDDYDQSFQEELLRQIITLAEEFLNLIINVLMERYTVGLGNVTKNDVVKNEIIHLLCLNPMPHSELSKSLPDDPYHDTGLDDVVNDVADFKKPTSSQGKGLYELKPECYAQYNPYFYHYSRAEQSKSEEVQRKRKKLANEDQALPPPFPPAFTPGFTRIINLLTCDVMIYMMRLILQRTDAKKSRSWSETQLEKILFLIGIGLHEEKRAHEQGIKSFNFIERATQGEPCVLSLLEGLVNHKNIQHEAQKDLLAWVLKRLHEIRQLKDSSYEIETGMYTTSEMDEKLAKERKKKADKAARRREKIMAQMSRMQRNFIAENSELFENTTTEEIGDMTRVASDMDLCLSTNDENAGTVALGPGKTVISPNPQTPIKKTCILCQEEQEVTHGGKAMVIAAFVQKSTVLSKNRGKVLEDADAYNPLFTPADLFLGAHTSLCSHVMHADCWQRFYDNVILKERRRTLRFRHHLSYDIDRFEYLCPYCKTLSNTVIPLVPPLPTLVKEGEKKQVDLSFNDWLDGIQKTVHTSIQETRDKESQDEAFLFVPCPLSSITKMMAESVAKNFQLMFEYVYDDSSVHFHDSINEMLKKFSTDVYKIGLGVNPDEDDKRVPMMAWNTCAFTIMTIEQMLRHDGRPVFDTLSTRQEDCLSALVRFAAVSSNVINKDLIKKHCVTLLSALVCDSASKRLQETPCILELDVFHYLVSLCMSLPSLYAETDDDVSPSTSNQSLNMRVPFCDLGDLYLLHLAVTAHIVQIILTTDMEHEESMDVEGDKESQEILQVYVEIRKLAGNKSQSLPSAWKILRHVKEAVIPFLRNCALLFHYLSDVKPPDNLLTPLPPQEEFETLCQYLSLPTDLSQYFTQGFVIQHLVKSWVEDENVKSTVGNYGATKLVTYPMAINRVEPLPQDYSQLINKVSTFTCPNSDGDDSRAPTMCLVCGEMLCSQSYCCQTELDGSPVGAATAHAHVCGAGTGLFLRVRECQILLLSNRTKGCFYSPPYLDDYGETDQGLRRGDPLHLCPERYAKLQKLWLTHSIPEEIAHHLESNTNLISIEWNHL